MFNSIKQVLKPIVRNVSENVDESRERIFQSVRWRVKKLHVKEKMKNLLGIIGLFRGAAGI